MTCPDYYVSNEFPCLLVKHSDPQRVGTKVCTTCALCALFKLSDDLLCAMSLQIMALQSFLSLMGLRSISPFSNLPASHVVYCLSSFVQHCGTSNIRQP